MDTIDNNNYVYKCLVLLLMMLSTIQNFDDDDYNGYTWLCSIILPVDFEE